MYFLTINAGSSSIKFNLFSADKLNQEYAGLINGIGLQTMVFSITDAAGTKTEQALPVGDHTAATKVMLDWLGQNISQSAILAIGHRLVHGGPTNNQSKIIDDSLLAQLQSITSLDPGHLPVEIDIIKQTRNQFPGISQVACFDTAFFHDLPAEAQLLPIPRKYANQGLRRYGFHGLSYQFVLKEFERVAGSTAAQGKVILAHLGNGASLTALKDGKPIDTSMALTPAGGVPMSTRSGDLDPGILTYLQAQEQLSPEQINHLVNFESGLQGISEKTGDMKTLLDLEDSDSRAKDAVNIFFYQVRKFIGAYAAALGGLNSLVFTGGMGEASAPIRARICQGLEFLGISLDEERNRNNAERISADGAGAGVHVLATNEALTIAQELQRLAPDHIEGSV